MSHCQPDKTIHSSTAFNIIIITGHHPSIHRLICALKRCLSHGAGNQETNGGPVSGRTESVFVVVVQLLVYYWWSRNMIDHAREGSFTTRGVFFHGYPPIPNHGMLKQRPCRSASNIQVDVLKFYARSLRYAVIAANNDIFSLRTLVDNLTTLLRKKNKITPNATSRSFESDGSRTPSS
jgi:hypothetical protein